MDRDLTTGFRKLTHRGAGHGTPDPEEPSGCLCGGEWEGTGLCEQAQADGVPCYEVGRSCDACGRARPANSPETAR
jgi:hypothetical protein